MKRPATSSGSRPRGANSSAAPKIKVKRNSARPQIKASRGSGGPVKRRKVAPSPRSQQPTRTVSETDRRVAETRRQSLGSIGGGGTQVRAVAAGGAAAGAVRVVQEVARPARAVTRPVLKVVSGGLDAIPQAAGRATPATRSRLLIMLIGAMAAGLIYINVGKLESGDGFTRYQQKSLELQRENTALHSRIANLRAAERIKFYAKKQGLVMPAPQQFDYLKSRKGDAERAANSYSAPLTQAKPLEPGASASTGAPQGATVAVGTGL
jgi:hypothetical protein